MDLKVLETLSLADLQGHGLAEPWFGAGTGRMGGGVGHRLLPQSARQVADLLNWAQHQGRSVALNTQDAWSMSEPLWLDLSGLKQVRQYAVADFMVQVETGITLGQLKALLSPNWQAFPLAYSAEALLLDVLAEDRPALGTGLAGYPRDYVLKTEVATPDGQLTVSGADVVKNATGYDLAKLYVGGRHHFGVITAVTLKVSALPQQEQCWLFSLESLWEGAQLAEKLLKTSLPLSACELLQAETGQWQLLLAVAGPAWAMVECQSVFARLGLNGSPLERQAASAAFRAAQVWPSDVTVLEVAVPLSGWAALAANISKQTSLTGLRLQIRPAAGLVYISASLFPFASLRYLKAEVVQAGGVMQVLQLPRTDAANFSEAQAIWEAFNLPEEPVTRHLLKSLKSSYDPHKVLFSPRLPL